MNEKFEELPQEKRLKIINAGMEIFGKYEYKRAVTDEIAVKAGISKGLLFYYFHNKQSFYMYLYQYCYDLIKKTVVDDDFAKIDDFFEMIEYGANKKMSLFSEYPFIIQFVMQAFYSKNEPISKSISDSVQSSLKDSFTIFFQRLNLNKFKEGIDPFYIYKMLIWMMDGYLHELQNHHHPIDLEKWMKDFHQWEELFRNMVYKEEYL